METRIFHLQNLSALHVGTGQGVSIVDLPIMRSKATNLPIVPGSAIKGVLRDELEIADSHKRILFGPPPQDADDYNNVHAGAIAFGDAHLLLLPIRSFAGTVAYATCPYILRQYKRDMSGNWDIPTTTNNQAVVAQNSKLLVSNSEKIALEDLDIKANKDNATDSLADIIVGKLYPDATQDAEAWRTQVKQRFVVLPDDIFSFLADTATEIRTRIRIDQETRVVKEGALWTEENLPSETVLWGVIGVSASRKKDAPRTAEDVANLLPTSEQTIQIGGKHTVGRGLCRLLVSAPDTANNQSQG